ncbi:MULTISPECIES: sugar ABC transporter substrate-binding protein [unclassified Microbacterium]|uniref:sugar ABC transporter substrate-binding protein n=1 Tax=unclassified Microbacterium TaxID=2609290 RepID=UPI0022F03C24|nr:sugar ABC transporter substrate-binding protein [Streptomyces sp. MS2A]
MNTSKRRWPARAAALASAVGLAAVVSGCASPQGDAAEAADPDAPIVMVQVPTMDNSYWADVIKGAEQAGAALGLTVDVQVYGDSTDTQLSQVQQAGSKGVDMALLFAQDQASSPTLISAATEQGIYVTNIFSNQAWSTPADAEFDDHYVGYFLPDNVQDSYNMATSVLTQIGGKGKVLHITGLPGNTTAEERRLGVENALKDFPDVELVGQESGGENRVATQPVIEDLLTAHPDVAAVICHNDDEAIAVINALRDRGMTDVKVGGIDAIDEFLDDMKSGGNAAATVAIHGSWFGGYNVVRLYDAFKGEEYTPAESMMFQDSLTVDTAEAAEEYQKVVYQADPLPFDWKAMSRAEAGEDWDTQVPLRPIDPDDYWGRIGEAAPSGYSLPEAFRKDLDGGAVQSVAELYLSHAVSNPLGGVIELTRSGSSSFGQK